MATPDFNEENPNLQQQDFDDVEEDALSFCDLPLYCDAADWEDDHQNSFSSSSSSEDQQNFEFFCEEWSNNSPTTKSHQSDTNIIIFCGKLIPYKQPLSYYNNHIAQVHHHGNPSAIESNSKSSNESISSISNNSNCKGRKFDHKYDFSVQKVSMLTSPELRDMGRRQSRKITKSLTGEKSNGFSRRKGWLWRMIRALGCVTIDVQELHPQRFSSN